MRTSVCFLREVRIAKPAAQIPPVSTAAPATNFRRVILIMGFSRNSPHFDCYAGCFDENRAQSRNVLRPHESLLEPQPVIHCQGLITGQRIFKVGTEAAILALAMAGLLGVFGMVEVR